MPKKNPDKREAKRLEKLEVAKQSLRWRAAEMVKNRLNIRKASNVLKIIAAAVETHSAPKTALSDHGTQWYAAREGDTRFDIFWSGTRDKTHYRADPQAHNNRENGALVRH